VRTGVGEQLPNLALVGRESEGRLDLAPQGAVPDGCLVVRRLTLGETKEGLQGAEDRSRHTEAAGDGLRGHAR
jgi:hypothetical protein